MGDHRHATGEIMLSYRFMRMEMSGSQIGTTEVSPLQIATTVPNRFFGAPMQPPTLRVVPTEMTMDMHMFGAMYAPNDRVTFMAMLPYITKEGVRSGRALGGWQQLFACQSWPQLAHRVDVRDRCDPDPAQHAARGALALLNAARLGHV